MTVHEQEPVAGPGPHVDLRWIDLAASEGPDHPTVVDDIMHRRTDGMTVADVFTEDEAAAAVERLRSVHDRRIPAMFGWMLGMPLAELPNHSTTERSPYYDDADRTRALLVDAFGGDPFDRVVEVLTPMAGGLAIAGPTDGDRRYATGNVRWYEPGSCGLPAHVGNEFQMHGNFATEQLRTTTRTLDHFSWFVVLQDPEVGGALSVYDLLFESHTPAQPEYREMGRDDSDFDALPARRIKPRAGSMIFFGGGWRWHRVDRIGGSIPRITYGGFAGPSLDGTAVNFWF